MNRNVVRAISLTLILSLGLSFTSCGKKKKKKPQAGGTATVGLTVEPTSFDPHTSTSDGDKEILFNIYEGLMRYDLSGNLVACLATEHTISEDATVYTFTLREEVKFHDGSDLDASDVVYSIKRAAGLLDSQDGTALIPELDAVADVSSDELGQVVVTLEGPDSELNSLYTVAIIPEGADDIGETRIGTGPFVFDSYTEGDSLTLTKNENYWKSEKPYLDSVTFRFFSDIDSAFAELQNGNIDILPYITNEMAGQLDPEQFRITRKDSGKIQVFALNNSVAPFDDPRVRQAINYALNRDEIIALTTDSEGESLTTSMSPFMGDSYDPSVNGTYAQDLTTAIALMEQAGYQNGLDITITVPNDSPVFIETASAISAQLSAIGINASVEQVERDTWSSAVYTDRSFSSTIIELSDPFDPYAVVTRYSSGSSNNLINYSNTEYDRILSQIPLTSDDETRLGLYHQLLHIMTDDAASCYIQDIQNVCAVNKRLAGYHLYPIHIQNMSIVYLA